MKGIKSSYLKKIALKIISSLDKIIPKNKNKIVYNSFPDLSDNSFAMFTYISNNYSQYFHVWLVDEIEKESIYKKMILNYTNNQDYKIVKKNSLKGLFHYLTAKYVFFTHGLYTGVDVPDNHIVVNLWHGMLLKRIGCLDKNYKGLLPKFSYTIATSDFYRKIMSLAFNVPKSKVLVTGQPRNDFLFKNDKNILKKLEINSDKKIILWMPTYRKSVKGYDLRIDGKFLNDLPLISFNDLQKINNILNKINSILIIKLHPMDALNLKDLSYLEKYKNIKIIKNEDLEVGAIQLYSLLGNVDALITDYSSVYIDFLLTKKPIGVILDDIEDYKKTRGFIFKNLKNYITGRIIKNEEDFIEFISNPEKFNIDDGVNYKSFHSVYEKFSENICDKIEILQKNGECPPKCVKFK